jgi:gas vesicle protein
MSEYGEEMEDRDRGGERRWRRRSAGAGIMLGALATGVAIGMLTAPHAGRKTRRRLGRRLAGFAESPAARLSALSGAGRRAGRQVRDRWEELSEGLGRRARGWRDEGEEALEDLEERIEALEAQLEEARDAGSAELEDEAEAIADAIDSGRGGGFGRVLGFALGAGLTYFLVSDRTAMARARVQDAATKARRRATDEWDRFQREGGFQRFRERANGAEQEQPAAAEHEETSNR